MLKFALEVLKKPLKTGAVLPSSDELAEVMCESAQLDRVHSVVELGTGTGVFTERIQKKLAKDCFFFGIEMNPVFVKQTRIRCPDVIVFQDSAEHLPKYLKRFNQQGVDCIISGLPWANFSEKLQQKLLSAVIKSLNPGGRFIQFAYLHGKYFPTGIKFKELLEKNFSSVTKTKMIWKNIPPAFVYCAQK